MRVQREEVIAAIHKQRGEFMTADVAATLGGHSRRVSGHMESLGDAGQLKRVRMESGRYIWRHGSNWYVPCEQVADEVLTACAQLAAPFTSADVTEATGLNPLSAATALDSLRRRGKLVAAPREGLRRRYTLPTPDGAEWLPTNAAAERLGIHRRTLQRRAKLERLRSFLSDGLDGADDDEIAEYLSARLGDPADAVRSLRTAAADMTRYARTGEREAIRAQPDDAEWLPTNAAAERLGIHRRTLQRRARSGEFWTRTGANGATEYLLEAEAETEAPNIARALELARELIAALEAAR